MHNPTHFILANAEFAADRSLRENTASRSPANLVNLLLSKLTPVRKLAFASAAAFVPRIPSALFNGVLSVIFGRASEKVFRVAARRIIARVAHLKSFGTQAAIQRVRHAMSTHLLAVHFDLAVLSAEPAAPGPAIIRPKNLNLGPKAFRQLDRFRPPFFCAKFSPFLATHFGFHGFEFTAITPIAKGYL